MLYLRPNFQQSLAKPGLVIGVYKLNSNIDFLDITDKSGILNSEIKKELGLTGLWLIDDFSKNRVRFEVAVNPNESFQDLFKKIKGSENKDVIHIVFFGYYSNHAVNSYEIISFKKTLDASKQTVEILSQEEINRILDIPDNDLTLDIDKMESLVKVKQSLDTLFDQYYFRSGYQSRKKADSEDISKVITSLVEKLIYRLEQKGCNTLNSSHEILGLVSEEFDEMKDEVRANNLGNLENELLDVAIACIWGIVSINKGVDW